MQLIQNNDIEFTAEEAKAILNGDFAFKSVKKHKKDEIPFSHKIIIGIVIFFITLAFFHILGSQKKKRKLFDGNKNTVRKPGVSYSKI